MAAKVDVDLLRVMRAKIIVSCSLAAHAFDEIAALTLKIPQMRTSLAEVLFYQVTLLLINC